MGQKDYKSDPVFREFVRWKCMPRWRRKEDDEPTSEREWARTKEHAPCRRTLQNWKKTEAYKDLRDEIVEEWIGDAAPQAVETAKEVATQPDAKGHNDRKMLLSMAGHAIDQKSVQHEGEITHTVEEARSMTTSDMDRQIRERMRQQFPEKDEEEIDALFEALKTMAGAKERGEPAKIPSGKEETGEDFVVRDVEPDDWEVVERP